MTNDRPISVLDPAVEPTEPGWYASADESLTDYLIYLRLPDALVTGLLRRRSPWMAYTRDGHGDYVDWDYIAQAGPITRLIKENAA